MSGIPVALVIGQLTRGGAERQLLELARRLPAAGFAPTVVTLSEAICPYGEWLRDEGIDLVALPRRKNIELRRSFRLAAVLRARGVALVHAFLLVANAYAWLAARFAGRVPVLPSIRSMETGRSGLLHRIDAFVLRRSPLVLANSRHLAGWAGDRFGIPADRLRCVPNGLDTARFADLSVPASPRDGTAHIGTVCLFKPVKRIPFMLEAARRLAERRPETTWTIVGDGPEHEAMIALRGEMGLEDVVELPGARDDIPEFLAGLDVFVLTSENEGMPNVVLEAMAAGRPVVGTSVPGISEVVREGETGHLVASDDIDGFVTALVRLLDQPDEASRLGANGRRRAVDCYSAERMVERTTAVYRELLAEGGR